MVQIDSSRQVLLRGFLDGRPTPATPIHDLPSQYDSAPLPCQHSSTNQNSHYIHLLRLLHSMDTHPGRGQRPVCVFVCVCAGGGGKFTHPENTTCTPQTHTLTHTHRATPATYLCYITHATAYPSTSRSALHSASDRDASPELVKYYS